MEIFKVIKEYPMYSVSTEGRIRKNSTRKILVPSRKSSGYMQINLMTNDGRRKKEYVHRLVALTFLANDNHFPEVNHIDGVRDNNVLSNLEWVTRMENMAKSSWPKRITVYTKNGDLVGAFDKIGDACSALGLTESNVSACLHGYQKTHKGFIFEMEAQ